METIAATIRRQLHAHTLLSGLTFAAVAKQLGRDKQWAKARVSPPAAGSARGQLTVADVDDICRVINVGNLNDLLAPAIRPETDLAMLERARGAGVPVASARRVGSKADWDRLTVQGYLTIVDSRYRPTRAGEHLLEELRR